MVKKIVITLSGGMDSVVLLHKAAEIADEVYTVTFDYNQRHNRELDKVVDQLFHVKKHYDKVKFYNTKLDTKFIKDIAPTSSLTNDDIDTPNVKDVMGEAQPKSYVPFRNLMFLSMICSHAEAVGADEVWYGAAQADSLAGYWDGSQEFVEQINNVTALNRENRITVKAPLIKMSKKEIIEEGVKLNADFGLTYTCYSGEYPCDAESASSALRLRGFVEAGLKDPLVYKQQEKLEEVYKANNCKDISNRSD
jgi:7-cyano-7-deazaguanine synthase